MTTARTLFAPIGPTYDRMGATLSLGQDPRWRRFLVDRLPRDGGHVLDVATGTGLVAARLRRQGFRVTGVDQSPEMLAVARRRFRRACEPEQSGNCRRAREPEQSGNSGDEVTLVHASAEALPLASAEFDHLTFTYLLRYVDDPAATLAELARVVRPGGTVASLEFGVPSGPARGLWEAYVRTVLPLAGRAVGQGWPAVGDFLGGSIRDFWDRYPLGRQLDWWQAAGLRRLGVKRLSLGGGVVIWGVK